MNDFLQSIRNQSKDKRYQQSNRPRRSYDNNNSNHPGNHHQNQQQQHHNQQNHSGGYHRNSDNRNQDNHRNKYHQRPRQDHGHRDETLSTIKDLLESMVSRQTQSLEIQERRAIAEERKAEAIEDIASIISSLAGADFSSMEKVVSGIDAVAREFEDELDLNHGDDFFDDEPISADTKSLSKDEILDLIQKMRSEGSTYNEVAAHLTVMGLPTFSGRGKWHAQTIHRLCQVE